MLMSENTKETIVTEYEEEEPDNIEPRNKAEHLRPYFWKAGESGNPGGRPKDPVRQYLRRKFQSMSDPEIEEWLKTNKISGEFQWRQAEGNPTESKEISLKMPTPILGGVSQLSIEEQKAMREATMLAVEGTILEDTPTIEPS